MSTYSTWERKERYRERNRIYNTKRIRYIYYIFTNKGRKRGRERENINYKEDKILTFSQSGKNV